MGDKHSACIKELNIEERVAMKVECVLVWRKGRREKGGLAGVMG